MVFSFVCRAALIYLCNRRPVRSLVTTTLSPLIMGKLTRSTERFVLAIRSSHPAGSLSLICFRLFSLLTNLMCRVGGNINAASFIHFFSRLSLRPRLVLQSFSDSTTIRRLFFILGEKGKTLGGQYWSIGSGSRQAVSPV